MADVELDAPEALADAPDALADAPEDAPLLAGDALDGFAARPWQAQTPAAVVLLAAAIKLCVTAGGLLMVVPLYRLLEDALCHAHLGDSSPGIIDEMRCKADAVQARLAYLLGWFGLVNAVMTLLVAFPYGLLADRIGRKLVALAAYAGTALSSCFSPLMFGLLRARIRANPYLLMTGYLFLLVGGGFPVLLTTLYAVAADVSSDKEKASSFLYLSFGASAGALVGPLLAGLLMHRFGPWAPIYVALGSTPLVLCLFLALPETLALGLRSAGPRPRRPPLLRHVRDHVARGLRDLVRSLAMLRSASVALVLVTFLVQNAHFTAYTSTLAQYVSKRFGWTLAETSLLLSPLGLLNLVVLVALPRLSRALTSPPLRLSVFAKDLLLARASTLLAILGALVQGLSSSVGLFIVGLLVVTLGAADSPLARAAVSHHVDAEHTSRLYALIGIVEVLGSFIGGPMLAWFFDQGMRRGGIWMGLPWFYVALLGAVSLAALLLVRPPKRSRDGPGGGHDGVHHPHPE